MTIRNRDRNIDRKFLILDQFIIMSVRWIKGVSSIWLQMKTCNNRCCTEFYVCLIASIYIYSNYSAVYYSATFYHVFCIYMRNSRRIICSRDYNFYWMRCTISRGYNDALFKQISFPKLVYNRVCTIKRISKVP